MRSPKWTARSALAPTVIVAATLALAGCGRPFVVHTPSGFADLGAQYDEGEEYRAATPEGVVIGVRSWKNDLHGDLAFWTRAIERRIRENGGYALLEKQPVTAQHELSGTLFRFGHDEGRTPYLYTVAVFVKKKRIFLFEAGGQKAEFEKQQAGIDWAMKNLLAK